VFAAGVHATAEYYPSLGEETFGIAVSVAGRPSPIRVMKLR
jgi:hypothetical protein